MTTPKNVRVMLVRLAVASALVVGLVAGGFAGLSGGRVPVAGAVEPITAAPTAAPAPTASAPAPVAGADGVVPFASMMYNVITNNGGKVAIVGGFLADSTPLPAKVEVAVPKDAAVFWVGEVAGAADGQGQDIALAQDKRTEGAFDIYRATMTTFHAIQVEYNVTDPFTTAGEGLFAAQLSYTPMQDLASLALAAEVPTNAVVNNPAFVLQGTGGSGGNIYLHEVSGAVAGQAASAEITYTVGTAAGSSAAASSTNGTLTTVLIVVIVALIAVLGFVLLSKKMK